MTTSATARTVIKVTNNNDEGTGSLRDAIRQGNEAVKGGKAVEIAFTSSFHIKVKTGYSLEKGNWKFNQKLTKDIIIDGENASGPLFRVGNQNNINLSTKTSDIEELSVDVTRMHLINSSVEGGKGEMGGGGGLGAGSALMHFNGHVSWRDSSFQGNTVKGGIGAEGAKGGRSFYATGPNTFEYPTGGQQGKKGGGFNSTSTTSNASNHGKGGRRGGSDYLFPMEDKGYNFNRAQTNTGELGSKGNNGTHFGEAGGGGGGGGGGDYQSRPRTDDDARPIMSGYTRGNGNDWGNGGRGGPGGNGNFGAGGGVGGSAGANAGADKYWSHTIYPAWSWKARTPNWSYQNKQGANGRSGEWASAPKKASDPTRTEGGAPGRGGDGAALGTVSSFATNNEKSSLTFENVDFRKNNATGGEQTGRFSNIYSRHINIKYDNLTNSTGDSHRGGNLGDGNFEKYTNSATTDKSRSYANSGRFSELEKSESIAPQQIWSSSYQTKSSVVQTFGKVHQLGNSAGHTIVLHADHSDNDVQQLEIAGQKNLLKGLKNLTNLALKTKSEGEIRGSHKGVLGSLTTTMAFKPAAKAAGGALENQIDKYASKLHLRTFKKYTKYTVGAAALIGETIFNQMAEDARIEEELEQKRFIDKGRENILTLIPEELTVQPFDTVNKRTYDTFKDFKIGRDQISFTPQIKATVTYRIDPSKGGILDIRSIRGQQVDDNSARLIGQIDFTAEQTANAQQHGHTSTYFQQFLHIGKTNGKTHYVFAKDSQWQYFTHPENRKVGGIGNDRIIVKRKGDVSKTTVLTVNGFEGNDRIMGDSGDSHLKGDAGDDLFEPGKGSDTVEGGSGTDTTSYKSLKSAVLVKALASNQEIKVTNTAKSLDDKLSDVEILRTWGGSSHKLADAKEGYTIQTGATGTTEGSQYDDNLFISYASDFNTDPANTTLKTTTIVDGKNGNDSLVIDGLAAHIEDGQAFKLTYSDSSKSEGFITKTTDDSNIKILQFTGIEKGVTFTDIDWNRQGLPTVKPQTDELTGQVNTDIADGDSDLLTGSASSNQDYADVQSDELTGAPSSNFSNDKFNSSLQTGKLSQRVYFDSLDSIGQTSPTFIEEDMQNALIPTASVSHKTWGQEIEEQPIWAQKEFFIDPFA